MGPELLPVPPTRGGAIERWIRDAAVHLHARGHEVHVIARDHRDGRKQDVMDGVHYHFVEIPSSIDSGVAAVMFRGFWHYIGVKHLLGMIAPDVVHHHSRPAGLWLSKGGAPRAKQIISLHSMDYGWSFGYARWDRCLFNRGFAAATRVLGVSNFIREHAEQRYPSVIGKSRTVYNGVDGTLFYPPSPDGYGATGPPSPDGYGGTSPPSPDPPSLAGTSASFGETGSDLILYVGRVEERKGVHVLVDAFEQVISKQRPRSRLRIVGPHSYWDAKPSTYYQALCERCAANPRIEVRGPTYDDRELAAVYRDAAVSVVPSVFPEALGLTSLEAQASGVPVVVSNAGALPESVEAGKSGLVFENGNVGQLGEAVLSIVGNDERRRAMGAAAREWVMRTFSWDVIAAELEQTYVEAVAR
ncbi:MAG: glycosyltransferase family 4 protein [Vicinamibacterales bacterium]